MSLLTADRARAIKTRKEASNDAVFAQIGKLCDQRIRDVAGAGVIPPDHVLFTVPAYVFGLPLFNPEPMWLRLYRSLNRRGFEVYRTENPLELYVSWRTKPKEPSGSGSGSDDDVVVTKKAPRGAGRGKRRR